MADEEDKAGTTTTTEEVANDEAKAKDEKKPEEDKKSEEKKPEEENKEPNSSDQKEEPKTSEDVKTEPKKPEEKEEPKKPEEDKKELTKPEVEEEPKKPEQEKKEPKKPEAEEEPKKPEEDKKEAKKSDEKEEPKKPEEDRKEVKKPEEKEEPKKPEEEKKVELPPKKEEAPEKKGDQKKPEAAAKAPAVPKSAAPPAPGARLPSPKKVQSKTPKGKVKAKSPVPAWPAPPPTAEQLRQEKERLKKSVPAILACKEPIKINDEYYLCVRLLYQLFREKEMATGTYAKFYRAKDSNGMEQIMKVTPLTSEVPLKYKDYMLSMTTKIERYLSSNVHPSICLTYEIFNTTTKVYRFMEIITGPNADQWSKKNNLKENTIKKICRDVVEGMNFLTVCGIAHGAINTSHVMLNKDKSGAKLVGFGNAVLTFDMRTEQAFKQPKKQTSEWLPHMAPETIKEEYCPILADVWSFGTMVVALLNQRYPFDVKTKEHDKFWKVFCKRYEVNPSREMTDMLNKIFVDPKKRMNIQSLLLHPWLNP